MATMNISLPDPMKEWVNAQESTGKYRNASDYVRDLIRRDQERAAHTAHLQAVVNSAIASGESSSSIPDIMERVQRRLNV